VARKSGVLGTVAVNQATGQILAPPLVTDESTTSSCLKLHRIPIYLPEQLTLADFKGLSGDAELHSGSCAPAKHLVEVGQGPSINTTIGRCGCGWYNNRRLKRFFRI